MRTINYSRIIALLGTECFVDSSDTKQFLKDTCTKALSAALYDIFPQRRTKEKIFHPENGKFKLVSVLDGTDRILTFYWDGTEECSTESPRNDANSIARRLLENAPRRARADEVVPITPEEQKKQNEDRYKVLLYVLIGILWGRKNRRFDLSGILTDRTSLKQVESRLEEYIGEDDMPLIEQISQKLTEKPKLVSVINNADHDQPLEIIKSHSHWIARQLAEAGREVPYFTKLVKGEPIEPEKLEFLLVNVDVTIQSDTEKALSVRVHDPYSKIMEILYENLNMEEMRLILDGAVYASAAMGDYSFYSPILEKRLKENQGLQKLIISGKESGMLFFRAREIRLILLGNAEAAELSSSDGGFIARHILRRADKMKENRICIYAAALIRELPSFRRAEVIEALVNIARDYRGNSYTRGNLETSVKLLTYLLSVEKLDIPKCLMIDSFREAYGVCDYGYQGTQLRAVLNADPWLLKNARKEYLAALRWDGSKKQFAGQPLYFFTPDLITPDDTNNQEEKQKRLLYQRAFRLRSDLYYRPDKMNKEFVESEVNALFGALQNSVEGLDLVTGHHFLYALHNLAAAAKNKQTTVPKAVMDQLDKVAEYAVRLDYATRCSNSLYTGNEGKDRKLLLCGPFRFFAGFFDSLTQKSGKPRKIVTLSDEQQERYKNWLIAERSNNSNHRYYYMLLRALSITSLDLSDLLQEENFESYNRHGSTFLKYDNMPKLREFKKLFLEE